MQAYSTTPVALPRERSTERLPRWGVRRDRRGRLSRHVGVALVVAVMATVVVAGGLPARAASSSAGQYLVARGDTLTAIAQRFGVSVSALAAANGITDADLIYAGTYLTVPSGGTSSGGGGGTYRVQPGDTLTAIGSRFGVSVSALAAANGITNSDLIYYGKTLVIPGSSTSSSGGGGFLPVQLANNPSRYNAYAPLFDEWASYYGISASLLKGLCWIESGWQPQVVSATGAIGMCQLEPATTAFVSQDLIGMPMNPWSANDNIRMAAAYLRNLLNRSGGDVRTAVASYYQGFVSVTTRGLYSDTISYVEGVLAFQPRFV